MNAEDIANYAKQLNTPDAENAYSTLMTESTADDVPALIAAYDAERDPQIRPKLVEIIAARRAPESLPFLAKALQRPQRAIWQTALGGIAAIGGDEAVALLEAEKTRLFTNLAADTGFRVGFIDEAIEQISKNAVS